VMTPFMIPLLLFLAAKLYNRTIWIPPRIVAWQIIEKEFLPLLVGMALMRFWPLFSAKAQQAVNLIGNFVLVLVFALMLWKMGPELRAITPWVVLSAVLLLISSIAVMHWLVKGDAVVVRTFAVSNANRHVGLALLLSSRYMHNRMALPIVACYAISVAVLMIFAPRIFKPKEMTAKAVAG